MAGGGKAIVEEGVSVGSRSGGGGGDAVEMLRGS